MALRDAAERHVLIVDNDPGAASQLAARLALHMIRTHVLSSGLDALDALHRADYDAMVVRFRLSDMRADLLVLVALALQPHLERRTVLLMTEAPPSDITSTVVRLPCDVAMIEQAVLAALGERS